MSSDGSRFPQTISACLCLKQSRFQKANLDLRVSVCLLNPSIHTESSYNSIYIYILWIHMIQYDTLWYRIHRRFLVSAPGKWRLHARTPTISRGRPEQKPSHGSHGRIKQSDKSWYVGDSQISSRSGMKDLCTVLMSLFFADTPSWFPSMMKNVSKAARSPPLSVLPDQINQIADWHVTSGSFLILSDLFWSLCDYLSFRCFRFKHLCRAWQSSCQVSMERSGALQGPE